MTRSPREVPAERPHDRPSPARSGDTRSRRSAPRDVDSDRRARWLKAFGWAAFPGMFIGALLGTVEGVLVGLFSMVAIVLLAGGFAILISEGVGEMVGAVTNPRGRRGPGSHSGADALVARGEPEAAISLLEASLEEFPDDAEAMVKIARILRDHRGDPRAAIVQFRRARDSGRLTERGIRLTIREMLEAARASGHPTLVLADLRAYADECGSAGEREWAMRELARISPPGDASAS